MPHFLCRLATDDGRIISEPFFSPSFKECRKHFEEGGYCVLSVRRDWKKIQVPVLSTDKKINEKDFITFNQELVALIRAGYPILKSINILIQRVKNEKLKEVLMLVGKEIQGGKALSEAFAQHGKLSSTVYIASLMAGERSGNLAETISRYNKYARTISQTKSCRSTSGFMKKKDDSLNPIFLSVNKKIMANANAAMIQIFFFFTCFKIKLSLNFVNPATLWRSTFKSDIEDVIDSSWIIRIL